MEEAMREDDRMVVTDRIMERMAACPAAGFWCFHGVERAQELPATWITEAFRRGVEVELAKTRGKDTGGFMSGTDLVNQATATHSGHPRPFFGETMGAYSGRGVTKDADSARRCAYQMLRAVKPVVENLVLRMGAKPMIPVELGLGGSVYRSMVHAYDKRDGTLYRFGAVQRAGEARRLTEGVVPLLQAYTLDTTGKAPVRRIRGFAMTKTAEPQLEDYQREVDPLELQAIADLLDRWGGKMLEQKTLQCFGPFGPCDYLGKCFPGRAAEGVELYKRTGRTA